MRARFTARYVEVDAGTVFNKAGRLDLIPQNGAVDTTGGEGRRVISPVVLVLPICVVDVRRWRNLR